MSQKNAATGYAVTLRYLPGIGFAVEVSTDAGEHQQSPDRFSSLPAALRLAQKTLAEAGFTVEIDQA